MKSRAYMKGAEFKARQGWLPFVDAVGIVLEVLEPVKATAWGWYRKWVREFRSPAPSTVFSVRQLEFMFVIGDAGSAPG